MTALRSLRRAPAAALAVTCALTLAGCGVLPGDSDDDSGPIVVMTWAPSQSQAADQAGMPAMAQAYARWVNANGGVNGRPLKVLTCDERNDPAAAIDCAQRAREEGAVAVVGSYSQHSRSSISVLETAGIPYVGGYGLADEEFTSPFSYPINGGQGALLAGNGRQLSGNCDRVSLVRPDTIVGDRMSRLFHDGLVTGEGRQELTDILAPEDATEYAISARRALEAVGVESAPAGVPLGVDAEDQAAGACVAAVLSGRTDTFFDSFRRLQEDRPEVLIASIHGSVEQSLIDRTGGAASPLDGAYATGWYPVSNDPRWEPMRQVIQRHAFADNRIDPADSGVQTTWIAYTVLRSVLESLDGSISSHSVREALDATGPIPTGGLTPPLSWRYEDMLASPDYPRLVNSMVTYQQVRGGQLVAARKEFVDVAPTLENSSWG